MDVLHWATLGFAFWGLSVIMVVAVLSAARRCDDAKDRDLAEAIRVRDLGLPSLPPLTSRSMRQEPAQAHPGSGSA
jgi:hypothetical protein